MGAFRKQVYISISIIVGSFLIFGTLFYFLNSMVKDESAKAVAARQQRVDRILALENLSVLKQQVADAATYKIKIDSLLQSQDSLGLAMPSYLDGLSRAHNVSVNFNYTGMPLAPTQATAGYVTFNMGIAGDQTSIAQFLGDVETKATKFLMSFDSINFYPDGQSFRADVLGRVYFK